jgi:hypothetical protein
MSQNLSSNTRIELQTGFYALPLDEMDMVLGAEWLM